MNNVHIIDLNFMGMPGVIASYLIPHAHGAILVETGPGSTLPALQTGLKSHGFTVQDVTDVLLTHIHLDHAGAAGWLARQGARVYVHPNGAPHLLDPARLFASAARVYGEENMHALWGEFLPTPQSRLVVLQDGDVVEIERLRFHVLETPGHASHHFVYFYDGVCFSGDVGGIRMFGRRHVLLPTPPPEFHLEQWRGSLQRLKSACDVGEIRQIAPTHFGVYDDPNWHLAALQRSLDELEGWMEAALPAGPEEAALIEEFRAWEAGKSTPDGLDERELAFMEALVPAWMTVAGIQRYWMKVRNKR